MSKKQITIDIDFFEHLLNCLANQKFIRYSENMVGEDKANQEVIDKTWNTGMCILNDKSIPKDDEKFLKKYIKIIKENKKRHTNSISALEV